MITAIRSGLEILAVPDDDLRRGRRVRDLRANGAGTRWGAGHLAADLPADRRQHAAGRDLPHPRRRDDPRRQPHRHGGPAGLGAGTAARRRVGRIPAGAGGSAPGPVEDCYAGLVWTAEHADELGIDPDRIIIAGASAGGGLAAGVALLARDRGGPALAAQALMCPMLDDRNNTPSSRQMAGLGVWDQHLQRHRLVGAARRGCGGPDVSKYAAPARETDLSGLPPAFIDVGSAETFRDEDVAYASGIWQAGGVAELHVWPGGFHGFDMMAPQAAVSQAAKAARVSWLRRVPRQLTARQSTPGRRTHSRRSRHPRAFDEDRRAAGCRGVGGIRYGARWHGEGTGRSAGGARSRRGCGGPGDRLLRSAGRQPRRPGDDRPGGRGAVGLSRPGWWTSIAGYSCGWSPMVGATTTHLRSTRLAPCLRRHRRARRTVAGTIGPGRGRRRHGVGAGTAAAARAVLDRTRGRSKHSRRRPGIHRDGVRRSDATEQARLHAARRLGLQRTARARAIALPDGRAGSSRSPSGRCGRRQPAPVTRRSRHRPGGPGARPARLLDRRPGSRTGSPPTAPNRIPVRGSSGSTNSAGSPCWLRRLARQRADPGRPRPRATPDQPRRGSSPPWRPSPPAPACARRPPR